MTDDRLPVGWTVGLLDQVTTGAPSLPSRVVLYASEKSGKTSFGCFAPKPIFLMTSGETGLLSLIESGQVPATPHFPSDFRSFSDLENAVAALGREEHSYRTLVLDTGNGAELMLQAEVTERHFGGDVEKFGEYGRGMASCVPRWAAFLRLIDDVRLKRGMSVLFLHHAKVKSTQNPTGKDWDQYRPEALDKLWALTHKWADVIAYYGIRVTVSRDDKATGETRYMRCAPSAAVVAGNRYGMPDEITASPGAANLWKAFAGALVKAKAKARDAVKAAEPAPALVAPAVPVPLPQTDPTEYADDGDPLNDLPANGGAS